MTDLLLQRGALELLSSNQLLACLTRLNPFGGYTLPTKPDERERMIETILRYERVGT